MKKRKDFGRYCNFDTVEAGLQELGLGFRVGLSASSIFGLGFWP